MDLRQSLITTNRLEVETNVIKAVYNCSGSTQLIYSSYSINNIISMEIDGVVVAPAYSYTFNGNTQDHYVKFIMNENLTTCYQMFYNIKTLKKLDLSGLRINTLTNLNRICYGCSGLLEVHLLGMDSSNVTDMGRMFFYSHINRLDMRGIQTSSVTSFESMLCDHIVTDCIDMRGLDFSSCTSLSNAFSGSTGFSTAGNNLRHIYLDTEIPSTANVDGIGYSLSTRGDKGVLFYNPDIDYSSIFTAMSEDNKWSFSPIPKFDSDINVIIDGNGQWFKDDTENSYDVYWMGFAPTIAYKSGNCSFMYIYVNGEEFDMLISSSYSSYTNNRVMVSKPDVDIDGSTSNSSSNVFASTYNSSLSSGSSKNNIIPVHFENMGVGIHKITVLFYENYTSESTQPNYVYIPRYKNMVVENLYGFTPNKCLNLTISADDVGGRKTETTVYYTALVEGYDYNNNIVTKTITGEDIVSIGQNTTPDSVQKTISYTYLDKTATTTITQGPWVDASYTVNLNSQWQLSSTISNPDSSLYEGVYQSYANKGVNNSGDSMYIDIDGYTNFKLYIRSYAESSYDYVMVSQLDKTLAYNSSYSDTTLVKAHTRGNQKSGTTINDYTLVEFTDIPSGSHRIQIIYRKDSSANSGDDRGYVLIPKEQ